jgi:adenylate cyclase
VARTRDPRSAALGILIGAGGALLCTINGGPVEQLRSDYLDSLLRTRPARVVDGPTDPITLVAVDQSDFSALGARPLDALARAIRTISGDGARTIALDFSLADPDPATRAANEALDRLSALLAADPAARGAIEQVRAVSDRQAMMRDAIAGAPLVAAVDTVQGPAAAGLSGWAADAQGCETLGGASDQASVDLPEFRDAEKLAGDIAISQDADGRVRFARLVHRVGGDVLPSFAVQAVRRYREAMSVLVECDGGALTGFSIDDDARSRPDAEGRLRLDFAGSFEEEFPNRISLASVLQGGVSADRFRDKLVFVGPHTGFEDRFSTPIRTWPGVGLHALAAASLLEGRWLERSVWTRGLEIAATFLAGLGITLLFLSRESIRPAAWIGVGLGLPIAGHLVSRALVAHGHLVDGLTTGLVGMAAAFATGSVRYLREAQRAREQQAQREAVEKELGRYFSPSVLQLALRQPELLKPARRDVSVLFSDIRGFTGTSETMEPEALAGILEEHLSKMTSVVFDHQGTLDKYIGDALMAIFGAPQPDAGHAGRACRAALAMTRELETLREGWRRRGMPPLDIGIGINSGEVVVGRMGTQAKAEYTCLGDVVNFASRAEGLTRLFGNRIVVGDNTRRAAGEALAFRGLGRVRVKGKTGSVRVHELLGEGASPAWLERWERGLAAFEGRDWAGADEAFRAVIAARASDPVADVMLERIAALRRDPPPEGWDGTLEGTVK